MDVEKKKMRNTNESEPLGSIKLKDKTFGRFTVLENKG